jgi:long-chain acyl-CoA synthetase
VGVNVGQILRQAALSWPTRIGLLDAGSGQDPARELTYPELDRRACRVAARLLELGLGPGDCVAVMGTNSAEFVAAWFGIVYAGCAVVPIPILSAPPEVRMRVQHARCRALLFDAERAELVRVALEGVAPVAECIELHGAGSGARAIAHPADTEPSDTAMVLYTSGTTGNAKGAAISHASLTLHTAVLAQRTLGLCADDRVLGLLPLTHSYGCRTNMLASFFAGARVVLAPRFEAARALALLRSESITWLAAVPTMYAAFAAEPACDPLPALRWGLCAGAPLADEVARRAEQRLGVQVRQGYGMTEASFCTLNAPPDARVLGSVGKPVWGIELKVIDADGREVPPGEHGEVIARGHNVMSRYLHDPEATAAAMTGGFFHTGDVGRLDADGRLAIVGRIKDVIIRGGYNVYPSEVEDALAAHPEVQQVVVVGRPDDYYGEEVIAVIVARGGGKLDAAELLRFVGERVARTKMPRELAFTDELPLGPSGKVLKHTLRQWLLEGRLAVISPGLKG